MTQMDQLPVTIPYDLARAILACLGRQPYAEVKVLADALGERILEWENAARAASVERLVRERIGPASEDGAKPTGLTPAIAAPGRTATPGPTPHTPDPPFANGRDRAGR